MNVYHVGSSNECSSLHDDMPSAELPSVKSGGPGLPYIDISTGNPAAWLISPNQSLGKIEDLISGLDPIST